uniref:C2H2-type domain-containing protein n=1 Tax=Parastrongyloides trichosuri TaxID=131310 RepID=A0A0N4ZVL8_PARTI
MSESNIISSLHQESFNEELNIEDKIPENVIIGPIEKRCFVRRNESNPMTSVISEVNEETPTTSCDNGDNNKEKKVSPNGIKNDALNCEYIQLLVRNSKAGSDMKNRSNKIISKDSTSKMIAKRLRATKLCDIRNIVCLVEDCGRMFQNISVLAFHLTYSHQNHYMPRELRTMCLICGHKFTSIQGKRVHVCNVHKKIWKQHNDECIKQTAGFYQSGTSQFNNTSNNEEYFNWEDDDSDEDMLEEIIYQEELKMNTTTMNNLRRCMFSLPKVNKSQRYAEKRIIGFSANQMYDVVNNVEKYAEFVPWCKKSEIHKISDNLTLCDLTIGFPPLSEKYKSRVTSLKPYVVHSVCADGSLFETLDTTWRFGPGIPSNPEQTCTLHFSLTFQFKYSLHAQLSHLFFDQVVKTMVKAFLKRAENLYGPPSFDHFDSKVEIIEYKS